MPTTPKLSVRDLLDEYAGSGEKGSLFTKGSRAPAAFVALRAVLVRHRAEDDGYCFECVEPATSFRPSPVPYPCATVQDILEALETP